MNPLCPRPRKTAGAEKEKRQERKRDRRGAKHGE